jgi:hypothetical protein
MKSKSVRKHIRDFVNVQTVSQCQITYRIPVKWLKDQHLEVNQPFDPTVWAVYAMVAEEHGQFQTNSEWLGESILDIEEVSV